MSPAELSRFLLTRGLWLVFLEIAVLRGLIWFNLDYTFFAQLQVIWAIGVSMIVLSAAVRLPIDRRCRARPHHRRRTQRARRSAGDALAWAGHAGPERARQNLAVAAPGRFLPDRAVPQPDRLGALSGAAVDRHHVRRLCAGAAVRVACRATDPHLRHDGHDDAGRLPRAAHVQHLWRSTAVDAARRCGEERDGVLRCGEVPALPAVRAGDTRAGAVDAGVAGRADVLRAAPPASR